MLDTYTNSEAKRLCRYRDQNAQTPLRLTYSAFHGVGYNATMDMFAAFGFPKSSIVPVKEQCEPDPDFTTVSNPNPEEGLRVLGLVTSTAEKHDSSIALVNDPDADRIQVVERQAE